MALIESMSKKVCMHSDVYFRTNKQTGATYTGKLCNPSDKAPSAAQIAAKARFAKVGMAGLNTLLYGWKKFRKYGARYLDALKHREWLYITEVMDLSEYAGYDLTRGE